MNNLIERVIEVVCEYFGVEEDKLLLKRSYASVCDARKFIIYILHCDFGVPASTLAKRLIANWKRYEIVLLEVLSFHKIRSMHV